MAGQGENLSEFAFIVRGRENVDLFSEFLKPQPRLMKRACRDSVKIAPDQRKEAEHGEAFERQQNLAACPCLYGIQDQQVFFQEFLVNDIAGGLDLLQVPHQPRAWFHFVLHLYSGKTSVHWRPYLARSSMNGSGSNCSRLKTPFPAHLPVSIILAPTIAGTPVV